MILRDSLSIDRSIDVTGTGAEAVWTWRGSDIRLVACSRSHNELTQSPIQSSIQPPIQSSIQPSIQSTNHQSSIINQPIQSIQSNQSLLIESLHILVIDDLLSHTRHTHRDHTSQSTINIAISNNIHHSNNYQSLTLHPSIPWGRNNPSSARATMS